MSPNLDLYWEINITIGIEMIIARSQVTIDAEKEPRIPGIDEVTSVP